MSLAIYLLLQVTVSTRMKSFDQDPILSGSEIRIMILMVPGRQLHYLT